MSESAIARRREAHVLLVGAIEPEVQPWLRGAGHATRAVPGPHAALAALEQEPADLIVVDRERGGADAPGACRALRADPRRGHAWLLAITPDARARTADAVLHAGADDFLHRPFSRTVLLARAGAGLRAARQRGDDALLRALVVNVPGAIYRSAWHAGHALELVSDEIERISGFPPANFLASGRRTLLSLVHPDDVDGVLAGMAAAADEERPFVLEYRIVRADGAIRWVLDRGQLVPASGGRRWADGAVFDITERREAEQALRRREIEQAREAELRASRARIVEAADAARRRIERDLHDGAQQRLVALALDIRVARARVAKQPDLAVELFDRVGEALAGASAELRELARGIHPAVLTEHGLAPAVGALAARAPVPVDVLDVPEERLPSLIEATVYFTVSEALTNVAKYADASRATVRIARKDGSLAVEIRDDGIGGADPASGSGLGGLADRVGACGGELTVQSPPGAGTLVRAVLPLDDPAQETGDRTG